MRLITTVLALLPGRLARLRLMRMSPHDPLERAYGLKISPHHLENDEGSNKGGLR